MACDKIGLGLTSLKTGLARPNSFYMPISINEIIGEIPSSLGNCSNLTSINLCRNKLTGVLPQKLRNLAELHSLNISKKKQFGWFSASSAIKRHKFDVRSNLLNGSIPSSWTDLSTAKTGRKFFGSAIPSSIGELVNLFYPLNLSNNALTCSIPQGLGKLKRLQQLDLSHNRQRL
ncbi:hypothetical protein Prudu_009506 [Prunus dulcis]|uniref:Uncharacterized protein n=1 Tax=Prunus dulcis TaxID=3755 RepID=A0A4Y1R779_PRUDU|nr:hypothetical protein Prudu_009506 [Prunus dulcis]